MKLVCQNLISDGSFENNNGLEAKMYCDEGIHKLSNTWKGYGTCQLFKNNECLSDSNYLGTITMSALNKFGLKPIRSISGDFLAAIRLFDEEVEEWHEFIFTKLIKPLDSGKLYNISFNVALSGGEDFISTDFGVGFTQNELTDKYISNPFDNNRERPYSYYNITNVMFDKSIDLTHLKGWQKVNFQYQAKGNEVTFIIGNFKSDKNTLKTKIQECASCRPGALIFIDDVSVEQCHINEFNFPIDSKVICRDSSYTINLTKYPYYIVWNDNSTEKVRNFNSTNTYSASYTDNKCTLKDTLNLYKVDSIQKINDKIICNENNLPLNISLNYPFHSQNKITLNNIILNSNQISIYKTGEYLLKVENNGCVEKEEFSVITEEENYVFYPNPATDYIKVKSKVNGDLNYKIIDNLGRLVETGICQDKIDITNLSVGVYYILFPNNCLTRIKLAKI